MKQSLQLRMSQQLAMTPQLQQAIKLLQLSSLDLQQEIQEALESNLMLETAEDEGATTPTEEDFSHPEPKESEPDYRELDNLDRTTEIPGELALDLSWEQLYESLPAATPAWASGGEEDSDFFIQRAPSPTLHDHLSTQLELTRFSERDYAIATTLIDAINEDGYLSCSLDEIQQGLESELTDLELDELQAVLHRIQNFEPAGIAATDLADCLKLQLRQLPEETPWRSEALDLVNRHLDLLAKRDPARLKRLTQLSDDALGAVIALIRSLDPKPGRRIVPDDALYVIPDVYVIRQEARWRVTLNPDIAPRLRINPFYSGMVRRGDQSESNSTLRHHLQEARWFIKSLHSRNETLLRVANSIVERQQAFFDQGEVAMKPLILRDIAEELGMHESTISRVTTQKYMRTPKGTYEFKYFFSSHVSTQEGGECSATAIKAQIKELIAGELVHKPLSDEAIAHRLQERGINVARRTIAKYREALSIPSSSQRKQLF